MQTEPATEKEALAQRLERIVSHLERLNARIVFLAQALDLPLQTPAQTLAALQCDEACAHGANKRETRLREELRGLLVMRYDVVLRMARSERLGAAAACHILHSANDRLLAKGYDQHAPGMQLGAQFDGLID